MMRRIPQALATASAATPTYAVHGERRIPGVISAIAQGYRAGAATRGVRGERGLASTYGARPSAAVSSASVPMSDKAASRWRPLFSQFIPRRGISKGYTAQMMSYANFNPHSKKLVNPVEYYKKKRIVHRVHNKLITKAKGEKVVVIHDDTAFSFRSITGLVVENQLNSISVAKALTVENLVMDWDTGEYAFVRLDETNTSDLNHETELEDFRALRDVIIELLEKTHGMYALSILPSVFQDFLLKLQSDDLQVQHIICHALFLPCLSRALLRILLDTRLRKPLRTDNCPHKSLIKSMFMHMPYTEEELDLIVFGNVFLNCLHLHSAKEQLKWPVEPEAHMSHPRSKEDMELGLMIKVATRLIGINRNGVLHYPKMNNLPEGSEKLLNGVELKKAVQMLNVEFPDFEQTVLQLLAKFNLWDYLEVSKLFGKYTERLNEIIERDKRRAAEKLARDKRIAAKKAETAKKAENAEG